MSPLRVLETWDIPLKGECLHCLHTETRRRGENVSNVSQNVSINVSISRRLSGSVRSANLSRSSPVATENAGRLLLMARLWRRVVSLERAGDHPHSAR